MAAVTPLEGGSFEGPKFRAEYLKTLPGVLTGVVRPRCIHGVVLETKF